MILQQQFLNSLLAFRWRVQTKPQVLVMPGS
jgi:hypothetical protein